MALLPDSKIEEIGNTANIVEVISNYISLKKVGRNYQGLCPFHSEKTPSFTVSEEKQIFHCFGCGIGGNVFSFLMRYHNISFVQAVRDLAKRYQIPLPDIRTSPHKRDEIDKTEIIYNLNEKVAAYYTYILNNHPESKPARAYLEKRGFPPDLTAFFGLGYALPNWDSLCRQLTQHNHPLPLAEEAGLVIQKKNGGYYDRFRNRIIFPIFDVSGRVIAFGGRVLDDTLPKYLNSPETPVYHKGNSLYGLHLARNEFRHKGRGFIVEGYFDFLSLYVHGIKNVVATLGTALTPNHIRILKGYAEEFIILFDSDQAGVNAALRSIPLFLKEGASAKVLILPSGHDPDTFIRAHGVEKFEHLADKAIPLTKFLLEKLTQKWGQSLEGKAQILREIRPAIQDITDPIKRSLYIAEIADSLKITEGLIEKALRWNSDIETQKALTNIRPTSGDTNSYLEKTIIEILLSYPQYLPIFLKEGGGKGLFKNEGLKYIFTHLKSIFEEDGAVDARQLLARVQDPAMESKIAAIMLDAPAYTGTEVESVVQDLLTKIHGRELHRQKKMLLGKIKEAERKKEYGIANNAAKELMEEHKKLLDRHKG
ncbi:MAG TPA: DNA primase [Proteobacteria bacterium]|nr:DNA primase [Pseudomonadota bacterium]